MTVGVRLGIVDRRGHRSAQERCAWYRLIAITGTLDPRPARRPLAHRVASIGLHAHAPPAKGAPPHARPALQSP